jgi:flagellar hook-associated protein 3 FlgL
MNVPVSLLALTNQAITETSSQSDALAKIQEQASTGKTLTAPSDNPALAATLAANSAQNSQYSAYLDTINSVTSTMNEGVSVMQDASNIMVSAKSLALEGAQSSLDANDRAALAQQVDVLIQQLVSLGNTQINGQYIFSGAAVGTQPFVTSSTNGDGTTSQVAYAGSSNVPTTLAGPDATVTPYADGSVVFGTGARGTPTYTGTTGAAPGTGTDSASGDVTLTLAHTTTTYSGASGVQAGTSSPTGDTILGAHTLTIDDTSGNGSAGTVSLDGGPAIAFTNGDTNLKVSNNTGGVAYIDTSAIAAGFNGTVNLTSNGTLSTDGGATTTPIDFSGNQQVTDSTNGSVINVDTSNVTSTGTESIEETGSYSAFQVLISLRDALNDSSAGATAQTAAIENRIGELDTANTTILNSVGSQSAQVQGLQGLQNQVTDLQLSTQETGNQLGNADLANLVVQMQTQSTLLQMTYESISNMFQTSLLNFLPPGGG